MEITLHVINVNNYMSITHVINIFRIDLLGMARSRGFKVEAVLSLSFGPALLCLAFFLAGILWWHRWPSASLAFLPPSLVTPSRRELLISNGRSSG